MSLSKFLFSVSLISVAAVENTCAQTLTEVFFRAALGDPIFNGARNAEIAAQYQAEQSYSLQRPSAQINVSSSKVSSLGAIESMTDRASTTELKLTQTIFNRSNELTIRQAENNVRISKANLENRYQDLMLRVSQAYFNVIAAREAVEYSKANVAAVSEQLVVTQRGAQLGVTAQADVIDSQARLDLAVADFDAASDDLQSKEATLMIVSGVKAVEPLSLTPSALLPTLSMDEMQTFLTDDENVPAVLSARIALENANFEASKAAAARLPTVEVSAGFTRGTDRQVGSEYETSDGRSIPGSIPIRTAGATRELNLGLMVKIPLFSGFSVTNRVRQTASLLAQAADDLMSARQTVRSSSLQAYFDFRTNLAQARAYSTAVQSSSVALDAAKEGYRLGVRANIDVLNAQTQFFNARRQLAQARYSALVGYLKALQSCGRLSLKELTDLDALLLR